VHAHALLFNNNNNKTYTGIDSYDVGGVSSAGSDRGVEYHIRTCTITHHPGVVDATTGRGYNGGGVVYTR